LLGLLCFAAVLAEDVDNRADYDESDEMIGDVEEGEENEDTTTTTTTTTEGDDDEEEPQEQEESDDVADDGEAQEDVEESMEDMQRKVRATAKALGATGRFRAPAIIPRDSMDEFARELSRIKDKLTRIDAELGPRIKRAHDRLKALKAKIQAEKANIAALKKKIREHIRKMKKALTTKYADVIAALKTKLDAYHKSRAWLSALDGKVGNLNSGAPGGAKYEENLAEVKKSLADNSHTAESMLNMDVVSELENLETSRSMFDADTASDLEIGSLKLYETTRLTHLLKRMHKALDKKIAKTMKKLADIHRVKVPDNLHMGLRRAEENLKLLKHRLVKAKEHYAHLRRTDIPKENAAKRELKKIARIERHIYTSKE